MPRKAKVAIPPPCKVVLFVEGEFTPGPRPPEPFGTIWQQHLVNALGLTAIDRIVPINKKTLIVMNSEEMPKGMLSGVGMIGLDRRIAAELSRKSFDVALVAWDLYPVWGDLPGTKPCRWEEVLKLYRGLAKSDVLEDPWKSWSERRFEELTTRNHPSHRKIPPKVEPGAILSLCMVPTFEAILMVCEKLVLDLLEIDDRGRVDCPAWANDGLRPEDILDQTIAAANRVRPKPQATKLIQGGMKTAKHSWAEYILRYMIQDSRCLERVRQHPISLRLIELLSMPVKPATQTTPPSAPRATSGRRPR